MATEDTRLELNVLHVELLTIKGKLDVIADRLDSEIDGDESSDDCIHAEDARVGVAVAVKALERFTTETA